MSKQEYDEWKSKAATFEQRSLDSLEAIELKLDKLNVYASQIARWTEYCAMAALVYLAIYGWNWYKS